VADVPARSTIAGRHVFFRDMALKIWSRVLPKSTVARLKSK
jgi:hypothetical protein